MSRRCVSTELFDLGEQVRHGWLFTQLITQLTVLHKSRRLADVTEARHGWLFTQLTVLHKSRRLADVTESYTRIVAWPMSRRCMSAELIGLGEQARHGWLFTQLITQLTVLHKYRRLAYVTEVYVR
ncbi:hypothetical protein J6590_066235 [Homalodisca vitripennis]|nr:hypothetical protein J6590_066235 [Homalodisca vitripennis]